MRLLKRLSIKLIIRLASKADKAYMRLIGRLYEAYIRLK